MYVWNKEYEFLGLQFHHVPDTLPGWSNNAVFSGSAPKVCVVKNDSVYFFFKGFLTKRLRDCHSETTCAAANQLRLRYIHAYSKYAHVVATQCCCMTARV